MLISRPSELKKKFLAKLVAGDPLVKGMDLARLQAVRDLAEGVDFAMFKSVEPIDALNTHSKTRWYPGRFATALPPRAAAAPPPEEYTPEETRYLQQLLSVYAERHPDQVTDLDSVATVPKLSRHLQRQRVSFFRAEALKGYAREAVPPGTFEKLQQDIHDGVIDIADQDHPNGFTRLSEVLAGAGQLDLSHHKLITRAEIDDRKGVCHQLANDDRLNWMGEE